RSGRHLAGFAPSDRVPHVPGALRGADGVAAAEALATRGRALPPPRPCGHGARGVTLLIDNATVARVLTMRDTIAALERSYGEVAAGSGTCRPRIDIRIPTRDPKKTYRWG